MHITKLICDGCETKSVETKSGDTWPPPGWLELRIFVGVDQLRIFVGVDPLASNSDVHVCSAACAEKAASRLIRAAYAKRYG